MKFRNKKLADAFSSKKWTCELKEAQALHLALAVDRGDLWIALDKERYDLTIENMAKNNGVTDSETIELLKSAWVGSNSFQNGNS